MITMNMIGAISAHSEVCPPKFQSGCLIACAYRGNTKEHRRSTIQPDGLVDWRVTISISIEQEGPKADIKAADGLSEGQV